MLRRLRALLKPWSHAGGAKGEGVIELFMSIGVIFFLLLAVIQLSLICCTKLITNYAAWISARVWAVNKDDAVDKAKKAGTEVLKALRWGTISTDFVQIQPENEGAEVNYETTLGIPFILMNNTAGRITTRGWGAVPRVPNVSDEEKGDNKEQ